MPERYISVDDLGLHVRVRNALRKDGINTLDELLMCPVGHLATQIPDLGLLGLFEIVNILGGKPGTMWKHYVGARERAWRDGH